MLSLEAVPWTVLLEAARLGSAIILTGGAVRLMDDCLDQRLDALTSRPTTATVVGRGAIAYALALLAVAALLAPAAAATLFLAGYAVGMAGDWSRRLPSGLYGSQESAAAAIIGALLAGPGMMLAALGVIAAVQVIDDLADVAEDGVGSAPNLAATLGHTEAALVGVAALFLATSLAPLQTVMVLVAVPVVQLLTSAWFHPSGTLRDEDTVAAGHRGGESW